MAYEWGYLREILKGYSITVEGRNMLESGCNLRGLGHLAAPPGAKVVGVDVDPTVIEIARARAACYDAEAMSFRVVAPGAPLPAGQT